MASKKEYEPSGNSESLNVRVNLCKQNSFRFIMTLWNNAVLQFIKLYKSLKYNMLRPVKNAGA